MNIKIRRIILLAMIFYKYAVLINKITAYLPKEIEWIKNAICLHESICTLLFIFFLLHFYKRKSIDGTN
jgi:hypothetical protein